MLKYISLILFSLNSYASLSISPTPQSGEIALNNGAQVITILNNGSSTESLSLSSSQSGLFKMVDRCSGKSLKPKKSCYMILSVDATSQSFLTQLNNNGSSITNLKFSNNQSSSESISVSSSSLDFGMIKKHGQTGVKQIILTNTGSSKINPVITPSANVKILANRCGELRKNSTCSLYVAIDAAQSLGTSGSISGESISIKPSSVGPSQNVSISGTLNIPSLCLSNQHLSSGSCVSNIQSCSDLSSGILSGQKTWNQASSSFGACVASSVSDCSSGYSFSGGTCSLINGSVLEMKYEPSEDLLAIPKQTLFYSNQASFSRIIMKFTLTQKSYINSFQIKISESTGSGNPIMFGVYRVDQNPYTIDNCCILGAFDTVSTELISSPTLKTFTMNTPLLLEAGDYYIMDYSGLSSYFKVPLYYSPSNVSASVYGQEWLFGYKAGPVYSGGSYVAFNIPPINYAPYFKITSSVYIPPTFDSSFTPPDSKLFAYSTAYRSFLAPPNPGHLTFKIKFSVIQRSSLSQFSMRILQDTDSNPVGFNIYTNNSGTLGTLVASSTTSLASSVAPHGITVNFPNNEILEPGDYWIMDSGTSNFSFPLYSTYGKASPNLHFITCHGMNFGYGTGCGAPFGSSIYGADYLPWFDLSLTPVP